MKSLKNRRKIHVLFIVIVIIITAVCIFSKTGKINYNQPILIKTEVIPTEQITTTQEEILNVPILPSQMQSTNKLFTKSPYFSNAYLIFPNPDAKATKMLSGFDLTVNKLDVNNFEIKLISKTNPDEQQTFIISNGQKIYFIKRSSDKTHLNREGKHLDNYAVAVNMQGYILK